MPVCSAISICRSSDESLDNEALSGAPALQTLRALDLAGRLAGWRWEVCWRWPMGALPAGRACWRLRLTALEAALGFRQCALNENKNAATEIIYSL